MKLDSLLREKGLREKGELEASRRPSDPHHFFKYVTKVGKPRLDANGAVWMEVADKGQAFQVGLSANNILARGSDTQSAYSLLLWRADGVLKSAKHRRETMPEFEDDWELLLQARLRNAVVTAKDRAPDKVAKGGVSPEGGNDD